MVAALILGAGYENTEIQLASLRPCWRNEVRHWCRRYNRSLYDLPRFSLVRHRLECVLRLVDHNRFGSSRWSYAGGLARITPILSFGISAYAFAESFHANQPPATIPLNDCISNALNFNKAYVKICCFFDVSIIPFTSYRSEFLCSSVKTDYAC